MQMCHDFSEPKLFNLVVLFDVNFSLYSVIRYGSFDSGIKLKW